ncbi:MAG: hypothetical protein ACHQF2_09265 [Flavobacteriales bacterium]
MKKNVLLALGLVALLNHAAAQSNVKGRFSMNLGFDAGGQYCLYQERFQGNVVNEDTTGAIVTQGHFSAQYSFAPWFSLGLGFKNGNYVEDPNNDNIENRNNRINQFFIAPRFYFLNKNKFNMYAGLKFGATRLTIDELYNFTLFSIATLREFKSSYTAIDLGFNWYLSRYVGLWFNLEFNNNPLKLTRYVWNGTEQDLSDWDITLSSRGAQIALGLCFKFKE